jgi:hypothetical protein
MRTVLGTLIVIPLAAALLWAVNPWATCPHDGEEANFTGLRRNDNKDCEYRHIHMIRGGGSEEHRFWIKCED